jgi:hypothetical protein
MGAVLFFPDGVVGAIGRLLTRARRMVVGAPDRAILDAQHLSQATRGVSRPPSSDHLDAPRLSQATRGVSRPPSSDQ